MSEVLIYSGPDSSTQIEVRFEQDNVWLNQQQMATLFDTARSGIAEHISNILAEKELEAESTCRKIRQVRMEGKRNVSREIDHFNLDMIISVGYRVNSKRGTQFRQWATQRLRDHLLQGYTINEKLLSEHRTRLEDMRTALDVLQNTRASRELNTREWSGVLELLARYASTLEKLERLSNGELDIRNLHQNTAFKPEAEHLALIINELRKNLGASKDFGIPKDEGLTEIIQKIFGNASSASSIEQQAAELLYSIIRERPFRDGNKRIAAFLFVYFLERNNHRYDTTGELKINANGLTALTLLVSESKMADKELIIKLIINLIR